MTESTKVRLVRCPKCENLLSEPKDSPFFQCGGCFTVLRAKIKEREAEADSVSDKSVEHGAKKPVSVNSTSSPEKAIVDSSDETSSDDSDVVPSSLSAASLRHQQNVPVLAVETDPCFSKGEGDRSILVDKDDPKSQSGRQDSGLDQFRKRTTKRCDSDSVVINRLSTTSKYPCDEGPSSSSANNYFPDSVREFQKHLKDQSNEAIEQDRAGLLRQLEKLKEQLVQSCNVPGEKPKESLSSTGLLNKGPPMRFHSLGNHAVGGPSYYHQHTEPQFSYNNNNSSEVPHSLMHPSFGDPHRFQMHGRGPHPLQPSHPYYSGQYVGNNNNSHDLFDAYPQQNNGPFHNSSCSCYHCYENKYWRGSAPVIPDAPYNAGFYPHESVMGFAPPYNPRTYASRGLQPHGRWPSNFTDTQMDSLSRIRPPRVVLPGGSRHIRPLAGGAPFITCQNCFELLQLPKKPEAGGTKKQQKVRCGACSCLIDLSVVNNKFVLSTNTASTRQGEARVAADYTSDDYDLLGYVFHSLDDEPRDLPGLISDKSSTDMQHVHSHSASLSEGELSSDSLTAKPLAQAQDSPLHDNYVDYSSINHDRSGAGSRSSRSEHDRVTQSKTTAMRQNSMKEVSLASEMEVNFNDYSQNHNNSGVSKDQQQRAKKSGFASIVKKSFKDLTKSIQNDEGNKSNVSINGHLLTERLLRKAEKQAGAIQPGNYWYDYRAGFWGVMGGPGLGILPPFIEELNYTMQENCSGGTTGVFVNGRELHRKDLDLLAGRGLPPERDRSYIVDITGRVIDEDTGEELDCLGKLAPTIEKLKRGFGMRLPKRAT